METIGIIVTMLTSFLMSALCFLGATFLWQAFKESDQIKMKIFALLLIISVYITGCLFIYIAVKIISDGMSLFTY